MTNPVRPKIKVCFEGNDYFIEHLNNMVYNMDADTLENFVANLNRVALVLKEIKLTLLKKHVEYRISGDEYMALERNALWDHSQHQLHLNELNRNRPFSAEELNKAFVSGVFFRMARKKADFFIQEVMVKLQDDAFYVQTLLACIPSKVEWQGSNNPNIPVFSIEIS